MITVNQEPLDPAMIEEAFHRIKGIAEAESCVSCCERDEEFHAQAVDEVIDAVLIAQEAERRVADADDAEFLDEMEKTIRQWRAHGASWELIENQKSQLRDEVRAGIRMKKFSAELFANLPIPSDEEIKDYYDAHLHEYTTPPSAEVIHLLRTPDFSDLTKEHEFLTNLRRECIAEKKNFRALAEQHTQKKNGEVELGVITMEQTNHPFESILFSLNEGELSPVIYYENAFHLIMPVNVQARKITALEEVREAIAQEITARKKTEILSHLASSLRATANIQRI